MRTEPGSRHTRWWLIPAYLAISTFPLSLAGQATPEATRSDAVSAPTEARVRKTLPALSVTGNHTVEAGTTVDGIVVVGGDLRIGGEVKGDAAVFNGDLVLEKTGVVLGDALVTNGRIVNEGGRVRGEMLSISSSEAAAGSVSAGMNTEGLTGREARSPREDRESGFQRHRVGILSTLAFGLVLMGIGASLVFYARPQLEAVSDTIRASTVKAAATGFAAVFLILPVFVVLIVTLAVSIVGIPLLLVAIPLYPLVIFGGLIFGLLASAHAIGERTAEQNRNIRQRNSYSYLFLGTGVLIVPLIVSHLISMTGFLSVIGLLLRVVTIFAILVATAVGLGATILARGGLRASHARPAGNAGSFDDPSFFIDPLLEDEDV
ncbi:MAG: hypothetical protein LBG44_07365 [Gemmatimonadota bacterium]|jgi:hypothetical protein|nr:hypothetical protein [Gemmatimonadota bacterium]